MSVSRVCEGRGQRGKGGQCSEGVQHPDGLVDETVSQSAGSRPEAPHSPPGGQEAEEAVVGMGGVARNAEYFAGQVCAVNVLEGGQGGTDDLLSCSRCALQGLPAGCSAAIPHSDAAVKMLLVVPR